MQKTNTTEEIRNNTNKLVVKYYPAMGWIAIWKKGERTIITIPAETPIQIRHGDEVSSYGSHTMPLLSVGVRMADSGMRTRKSSLQAPLISLSARPNRTCT